MGLRTKLNLLLLLAGGLGALMFVLLTGPFLKSLAQTEVTQSARIMLASATGTRKYTSQQIAPLLLGRMQETFYPQAVSAYAAVKGFDVLHAQFPDYSYREPALNPTNPMDRASDWESDIIQAFRSHPTLGEAVRVRQTLDGPSLELAHPIRAEQACMSCHSLPSTAPQSMLAAYGPDHGFGWKPGEIVAAQVVSVPMRVADDRAGKIRDVMLAIYLGVFLVLTIILNLGLRMMVTQPVRKISRIAEDVSLGKADAPEIEVRGADEIAVLARSFTRMRRSLEEALRLLSSPRGGRTS
jgi:HAMP domain-containing protein